MVTAATEVVAHRKIDKHGARRIDLTDQVETGCHTHRRNPRFLCDSTNQTHGLMVEGSSGYSEQDVYPIDFQFLDKRGGRLLYHLRAVIDPTHETAPHAVSQPPNLTCALQLFQTFQREDHIDVALRVTMVVVRIVDLETVSRSIALDGV